MTSAIIGIVLGMGLMFGVSLYRFRHQPAPLAVCSNSARQRTRDSLRERYGL